MNNTELVPIVTAASSKKVDRNLEEVRFVSILGDLDLTRYFYFSYLYDITRTLQHNLSKDCESLSQASVRHAAGDYNEIFA